MTTILPKRFLILLFLLPFSFQCGSAQTKTFYGYKAIKPYTKNLRAIDKVELLKLKINGDLWDGKSIEASKVFTGSKAKDITSLWRKQVYSYDNSACHFPRYAIKFYSQNKLVAFATVCWECNNIVFIVPKFSVSKNATGFDARGIEGQRLLQVFTSAFADKG